MFDWEPLSDLHPLLTAVCHSESIKQAVHEKLSKESVPHRQARIIENMNRFQELLHAFKTHGEFPQWAWMAG